MTVRVLMLAGLLLLIGTLCFGADITTTFDIEEDTYVSQDYPTTNYVSSTLVYAGLKPFNTGRTETYISLDEDNILDWIDTAQLLWAKLWVYVVSGPGYQWQNPAWSVAIDTTWNPSTVTYRIADEDKYGEYGCIPWAQYPWDDWNSMDITQLIEDWDDGATSKNGVAIVSAGSGFVTWSFRSQEYGDGSYAPYIEVCKRTS